MPWTKKIDVVGELNKSISKELRKVAFIILRGVVVRTPVDTGRLKGAWLVGVNVKQKSEGLINSNPELLGLSEIKKARKYTDIIYIVNNMSYAQYIEDGHGGRTPGVMIKATLASL